MRRKGAGDMKLAVVRIAVLFGLITVPLVGGAADDPGAKGDSGNKIQATDSPKVIVARALSALGGEEKLARWNVGVIKYKVAVEPLPPTILARLDVVIEEAFQLPGHMKRSVTGKAGDEDFKMAWVVNDDKGWLKRKDDPPVPIKNDKQSKKAIVNLARHSFASFFAVNELSADGVTLKVMGEEKVEGRPCIVVQGEAETRETVHFCFDKTNALVLKSKKTAAHPLTGKMALLESYMSDYKDIDGGSVPMRIRATSDGKPIFDIKFIDLKFPRKLDEKVFAKPE
jgi:hypothetical protein